MISKKTAKIILAQFQEVELMRLLEAGKIDALQYIRFTNLQLKSIEDER